MDKRWQSPILNRRQSPTIGQHGWPNEGSPSTGLATCLSESSRVPKCRSYKLICCLSLSITLSRWRRAKNGKFRLWAPGDWRACLNDELPHRKPRPHLILLEGIAKQSQVYYFSRETKKKAHTNHRAPNNLPNVLSKIQTFPVVYGPVRSIQICDPVERNSPLQPGDTESRQKFHQGVLDILLLFPFFKEIGIVHFGFYICSSPFCIGSFSAPVTTTIK